MEYPEARGIWDLEVKHLKQETSYNLQVGSYSTSVIVHGVEEK